MGQIDFSQSMTHTFLRSAGRIPLSCFSATFSVQTCSPLGGPGNYAARREGLKTAVRTKAVVN